MQRNPNAVKFDVHISGHEMRIHAQKFNVGLEYPLSWEGPEVVAKKGGFNALLAKMMLKFDESTAENGNIYLSARGASGRFHYLLGIDKAERDVFFHIWDREEESEYGTQGVGFYVRERGRTHLKDYLKGSLDGWLILGIEWSVRDGPKFFAYKEGEKNFSKIPTNLPPEIRSKILKDSRDICLYGLKEFAIRTDLEVKSSQFKSIVARVDYVKVRSALFSWMKPRRTS